MCIVVCTRQHYYTFFGVRVSCGVMWQSYKMPSLTKAEIAAGIVPVSLLFQSHLFFVYNSYNYLECLKRCVLYSTRHIFYFWGGSG